MASLMLMAVLALQIPVPGVDPAKPAPSAEDKVAAELLRKSMARLEEAKVLHAHCVCVHQGAPGQDEAFEIDVKVMGSNRLWLVVRMGGKTELEIRADGRRQRVQSRSGVQDLPYEIDAVTRLVRKCVARSIVGMALLGESLDSLGRDEDAEPAPLPDITLKEIKAEGTDKVGTVEATVVSYQLGAEFMGGMPDITVKSWIDPATLLPVKRTLSLAGITIAEELKVLAPEAKLAAEDFSFFTEKTLRKAREAQVARSVDLFGHYTGHAPRALEDLVRRPGWLEADLFWPDGGFWVGDAIPKDIAYSVAGQTPKVGETVLKAVDGRFIVAPSARLKAQFNARVHVALLQSAVEAYRDAYQELPRKRADLSQRPDWATVWPDRGFLDAGKIPVDPWGKDYRIITEKTGVTVTVRDVKDRTIRIPELTPEELGALGAGESPRLAKEEIETARKLIGQLGDDDLQTREDAGLALIKMGPRIVPLLEDRLGSEKDPQVAGELSAALKKIPRVKTGVWRREMAPLAVRIGADGRDEAAAPASGERTASACLKILTTAQADFRSNDRDNNRINDFWVRDVSGLYGIVPPGGPPNIANCIKLIEQNLAGADATPGRGSYVDPAGGPEREPEPKSGYLFRSLAKDETGALYDVDGSGHNPAKWGVAAYPADYGSGGTQTFVVNEECVIWSKDLAGGEIDTFPADLVAEGWQRVD